MRWAVRMSLAAVVCLGLCVPAFADPPSVPVWEVVTIDLNGCICDHGFVVFGPLDPATGVGVYVQVWDGDVIQMGEWAILGDFGPAGCMLEGWVDIPVSLDSVPRHPWIWGYCINPVGIFVGVCWDDLYQEEHMTIGVAQ